MARPHRLALPAHREADRRRKLTVQAAPVLLGLSMPDVDRWSQRVAVALGQNPGPFTGPGTNTYLVGSGRQRILLDTGDGRPAYLPVLERALAEAGCELQEIVLTHGHPDHLGGARQLRERFGPLRCSKLPWPGNDERYGAPVEPLADGATLRCEGATLRAVHAPGHAPDHLCFWLEEEGALFAGDNVLGVGTTVIPARRGCLREYLGSLERLLALRPGAIYPAHGPRIADGAAKLREYLAHRREREAQILAALREGPALIPEIVARVYAAYPAVLHAAAAQQVCAHLLKLEEEGSARPGTGDPLEARWQLA
jgi:glyoxylase-like metal-dependent hydrolase (beta-lactamase superfamily II)